MKESTRPFAGIQALFQDPPPEFAFEITAESIAVSRTRPPATVRSAPLAAGLVVPSQAQDNIPDVPAVAAVVKNIAPQGGRRTATLIVPDQVVRLSMLDFDQLSEKEEERLALIRFRIRRTVPFDVDHAIVSYSLQTKGKVLVAVAQRDIIAQYEAPFRSAGLEPGIVIPASAALLELLPSGGNWLAAYRNSAGLSVLAVANGSVVLIRSLEWAEGEANDFISDLYATRVYLEDQTGVRPERFYLAGFGEDAARAAGSLSRELEMETMIIPDENPGLAGYLASLKPTKGKVAA